MSDLWHVTSDKMGGASERVSSPLVTRSPVTHPPSPSWNCSSSSPSSRFWRRCCCRFWPKADCPPSAPRAKAICASSASPRNFTSVTTPDFFSNDASRRTAPASNGGSAGCKATTVPEGQRAFDLSTGVLFPYLQRQRRAALSVARVELAAVQTQRHQRHFQLRLQCVSLRRAKPETHERKSKFSARRTPCSLLTPHRSTYSRRPPRRRNPKFEEFYYLDLETNYSNFNNQPNGHFRHSQKANVIFADGHVGMEKHVPGSLDKRLPSQFIGQLRPEILVLP